MNRNLVLWTALFCTGCGLGTLRGQEIGFVEDFALAADRQAVLARLVPGTDESYYYHAIHFQNERRLADVDSLLVEWINRHGRTPRAQQIERRQALLAYSTDPQRTQQYLTGQLGLRFDHQREIPDAERTLPSQLDAAQVSFDAFAARALAQTEHTNGFEDAALHQLAQRELNEARLRHLLQRLKYPDVPGLVDLIARELSFRDAQPFGALPIHRALTLAQLDELARRIPALRQHQAFVDTYLSKLNPTDDTHWLANDDEYARYLQRVWQFAHDLDPVFNSLKANILLAQLQLDRRQGHYDRARLIEYLKLPRRVGYIRQEWIAEVRNARHFVDTSIDYSAISCLRPIPQDETLVRSLLLHYLRDAADVAEFAPYIDDTYLRAVFAEAKITSGQGDPQQWSHLLTPEQYRDLMQRVDLEFAPTLPRSFGIDQPVRLELTTKNVPQLIVKVFEINTEAYYRLQGREIDTDVNLDGLIPHSEESYHYDDPPLHRVQREFEFAQVNGPGVWVIDFIGNGLSSRALIRKGRLDYTVKTTLAGQMFTVFDEAGRRVNEARLWIAGRYYEPLPSGEIVVPFSTQPGRQAVIVSRGEFSTLGWFQHEGEVYQLAAGIYVDRESLLRGRTAAVVVRPALYLNGQPIPNDLLKEIGLKITAVDLDGIPTTMEVPQVELTASREFVHEFQVPVGVQTLQFDLQAKVPSVTRGEDDTLTAQHQVTINQIDREATIRDVHLVPKASGYVLEVRGKTGEPLPKQVVQLTIKHRLFQQPYLTALQADDRGQIALGDLGEMDFIAAEGAGLRGQRWSLRGGQQVMAHNLHGRVGQSLVIPYDTPHHDLRREDLALFEMRGVTIVADRWDAMELAPGRIVIEALAAGDYELHFKSTGQAIRIRIADGRDEGNFVIGPYRVLERRAEGPLVVESIDQADDRVRIQLGGNLRGARVHVLATRYQPRFDALSSFGVVRDAEAQWSTRGWGWSSYLAGRDIGDEYRYILDRKYAQKYPGNMLPRPSLLWQPWSRQTVDSTVQRPSEGTEFGESGGDRAMESFSNLLALQVADEARDQTNLDFLMHGTVALWNLVPDDQGQVAIDVEALGDRQYVTIVAVNDLATHRRAWIREAAEPELRDLRLADGFDPQTHATLMKQQRVLREGETLEFTDRRAAKFQAITSLADVFRLYQSLAQDATLQEFQFVVEWPNKTDEEKRALYAKYACHELNFFLYRKDPAFFEQVVAPWLGHKRAPTLVDQWLSQAPLDGALDPWQFQRLNVFEKLMLAQRVETQRASLIRHVRELYQLNPTRRTVADRLFDVVIVTSSLSADPNQVLLAEPQAERSLEMADGRIAGRARGGLGGGGGFGSGGAAPGAPPPPAAAPADAMGRRQARAENDATERLAEKRDALNEEAKRADRPSPDAAADGVFYSLGAEEGRFSEADEMRLGYLRSLREEQAQLYRRLPPTEEWVETHYYRIPLEQLDAGRVRVNQFWRDYAEHLESGGDSFLSPHFAEAAGNLTEMMFALAVLDLPFKSAEHEISTTDDRLTVRAAGDMIVYFQQVQPAELAPRNVGVLVAENFFRHDDRYRHEGDQRFDKFIADEFLVQVLYGAQVVVTNPTSTPQSVDLLVQIPVGSLPAMGSHPTRTRRLELAPFSTQQFEYHFYFPQADEFPHFPAHVSIEQQVVASAAPLVFRVVDQPTQIDRRSWAFLSQHASDEEVLEFLQTENVLGLDLGKVAFRLADANFFRQVLEVLRSRKAFHETLWSYAVVHHDRAALTEYLRHVEGFLRGCGPYLQSELVEIDPIDRRWYEHREYWPLVNARAHPLGKRRQITNPRIHEQYHALLEALACRAQLGDSERLAVVYYLLLQDRIDDALRHFAAIDRSQIVEQMPYDYLAAYLAFYRGAVDEASTIARPYADHPLERWQTLFRTVLAQAAEVRGEDSAEMIADRDRQAQQDALAAQAPTLDFSVESRQIAIDHRNLDSLELRFYAMDIELLFSRNPFVQQAAGGFSLIRPNRLQTIELPAGQNRTVVPLPDELRNSNVLIEIRGGGLVKSQAYYAHSLAVEVQEQYGQLRVLAADANQPLAQVYVKVYGRKRNGGVEFYKDGYTDLRGRFDYVASSNQRLEEFDRLAILILSEEHGALIREAELPKE